jgi:hypothetical protein
MFSPDYKSTDGRLGLIFPILFGSMHLWDGRMRSVANWISLTQKGVSEVFFLGP